MARTRGNDSTGSSHGVYRCAALAVLLGGCLTGVQAQTPAQGTRAVAPVTPTAEDKRKAMDADVERLVQLARQLKAEVERSRQDELSIKVVRDADEIDRLARSARTRIH